MSKFSFSTFKSVNSMPNLYSSTDSNKNSPKKKSAHFYLVETIYC